MSKNTTKKDTTKFTGQEQDLINSSFLGFVNTLKLSISLFKNNFLQGFLLPTVIDIIGSIILYIPFFVLLIISIIRIVNFDWVDFEAVATLVDHINNNGNIEDINPLSIIQTDGLSGGFLSFSLVNNLLLITAFLYLLVPTIFSYFLRFKQFDFLLTDKTNYLTDFFQDFKRFFKSILGLFLVWLMKLPFIIITMVSSLTAIISLFLWILSSFVTPEIKDFLVSVDLDFTEINYPLWFFLSILLIPLSVLATFLIDGFFGLTELFIIKQDLKIFQALKESFKLSKKYFWQNTLRWFLFILAYIGVSIGISLIDSMLEFIATTFDSFLDVSFFVLIYSLTSLILTMVVNFVTISIFNAFYLTSFSNFISLNKDLIETKYDE